MNIEPFESLSSTREGTEIIPEEAISYVFQLEELQSENWLNLSDSERTGVLEQVTLRVEEMDFSDPETVVTILQPIQAWQEVRNDKQASDRYPEIQVDSRLREAMHQLGWEAPSDDIQAREGGELISNRLELTPERWRELSFEERVQTLGALEGGMAAIQHRLPCDVTTERMTDGSRGIFSRDDYRIILNESLVRSNRPEDFNQILRTTLHEGRHAYQDYCLRYPYTHPDTAMLKEWGENCINYLTVERNGFRAYYAQVIEADARAYAERVLSHTDLERA